MIWKLVLDAQYIDSLQVLYYTCKRYSEVNTLVLLCLSLTKSMSLGIAYHMGLVQSYTTALLRESLSLYIYKIMSCWKYITDSDFVKNRMKIYIVPYQLSIMLIDDKWIVNSGIHLN